METPISLSSDQKNNYQFTFHGKGSEFFSILIVNWLLTVLTLGLYYPWARAKRMQYVYSNTALNNERFHFAGTGAEMFKGFIKVALFYVVILVLYMVILNFVHTPLLGVLFLYGAILAIVPMAIHGSFKYKMSRTSYRGIRLGYRGNRKELSKMFFKDVFFTIISFGIYSSWLQMNLRKYTHAHIRYGDVEFSNNCNGGDWFFLNFKGYFFTVFTLGIYMFWWQRDIFNYYYDNMRMKKEGQKIVFKSDATGGDFFELIVLNLLIVVFTLGIGTAWAEMRTQKFMCDHIKLIGDIDLNEIHQTEQEYKDAMGEDAMDFFDFDIA